MRLLVGQAFKELEQRAKKLKSWPIEKGRKVVMKHLKEDSIVFKLLLHDNLIKNLHALSPGFASGSSIVERNLRIGNSSGKGSQGFKAFFEGAESKKAADIAHIWNRGGTIKPKKHKFLTQPLDGGTKSYFSPREFDDKTSGPYTSWLYTGVGRGISSANISQDVYGTLVFRKKGSKSKIRKNPQASAAFLVLRSQKHRATKWADNALKQTVKEGLPIVRKRVVERVKQGGFTQ